MLNVHRHLLMPLHDPVVIWRPFVNVLPAQLLMKLFCEVKDLAWPSAAAPISLLPSLKEPFWTALEVNVVPLAPLFPPFPAGSGLA